MSIVIELNRGVVPKTVLNQLYKLTALQSTFGAHLLALVENEPRVLSLKRALQIFIEHRQQVVVRRSQFDLEKARRRLHILDGLLIALANLDAVIQTIRESPDADQAKTRLMERFKLTEIQSQAILDIQLRRLAALERQKIEDEHAQITEHIAYLEDLLENPKKILQIVKTDLQELSEKYGDERRTRIAIEATSDLNEEDLVADEAVLVSFTQRGYIKRVSINAYRTQGRGRRGVSGQSMREEDEVNLLLPARTLDTILFFSDRGKVYSQKVHQIPAASRTDRGIPLVNLLPIESGERITSAVPVKDFHTAGYCIIATTKGMIKRVSLEEFSNVRPSGLIAMNLGKGDELGWARLTNGNNELILITTNGQALRISEEEIRTTGRMTSGVRAMKLHKDDLITSVEVVEPGGYLLVVTTNGFGKRSPLDEYATKSRATGGIRTVNPAHFARIGKVAAARVVQDDDEITFISSNGLVLRLKVASIRPSGRATRGIRLMDIAEGDSVASIARISAVTLESPSEENGNASENESDTQ